MAKRWTEQRITEALALAEATSQREAARQTGVPLTTLHRWYGARVGTAVPVGTPPKPGTVPRTGKKLRQMGQQVQDRAVALATERVAETLTGRVTALADQLYGLAEKAAHKVAIAMADPDELPAGKRAEKHNQAGASWGRFLVGVLAQSLEKAHLLTGKAPREGDALPAYMIEELSMTITKRLIRVVSEVNPDVAATVRSRLAEASATPDSAPN